MKRILNIFIYNIIIYLSHIFIFADIFATIIISILESDMTIFHVLKSYPELIIMIIISTIIIICTKYIYNKNQKNIIDSEVKIHENDI